MSALRHGDMLGQSKEMLHIRGMIEAVAPSNVSVLITGESGTGKELVARAIHDESPRRRGPFVALNCGAFPREILENEIFGHEKGAFTGAIDEKPGAFEQAHGGTLFLDEVAEMEPDIQVKLLRALEQRAFRRLGGKKEIQVDIRVVAATNKDLEDALRSGRLREDIYYRIAVVSIHVPPLRNRAGDARMLAQEFLERFSVDLGTKLNGFSDGALEFIETYRWPGNVRELINSVQRAVILGNGGSIEVGDLQPPIALPGVQTRKGTRKPRYVGFADPTIEEQQIRAALAAADWNVTRAAEDLGMNRRTLWERMRRYRITREDQPR